MRVIAGSAKGRPLTVPSGVDVRPTSDRVREALFSSLQWRLRGARAADLYAGSGALGIEALSRAADSATFVERSARVRDVLKANLAAAGVAARASVVADDVATALRAGLRGSPFDLVFLDPPYDLDAEDLDGVLSLVPPIVAADGRVSLERSRHSRPPRWPVPLTEVDRRRYGDTVIYIAQPGGAR